KEPYKFSEPAGREREDVRFELEALLMHAYGLKSEDIDHIFDDFDKIEESDKDEFGYYRTKEIVRSKFEELSRDITDKTESDQ
ncbi:MAG: hypothetical protein ABEI86_04355, partial [Halobacteriaceae archaeon]